MTHATLQSAAFLVVYTILYAGTGSCCDSPCGQRCKLGGAGDEAPRPAAAGHREPTASAQLERVRSASKMLRQRSIHSAATGGM